MTSKDDTLMTTHFHDFDVSVVERELRRRERDHEKTLAEAPQLQPQSSDNFIPNLNQGKTSTVPKSLVIRPATESSSIRLAASFILCHGESPFTRGRHYSMGELLVPQLRAVTRDNSRSVPPIHNPASQVPRHRRDGGCLPS